MTVDEKPNDEFTKITEETTHGDEGSKRKNTQFFTIAVCVFSAAITAAWFFLSQFGGEPEQPYEPPVEISPSENEDLLPHPFFNLDVWAVKPSLPYEMVSPFFNGVAQVEAIGKIGLIDQTGREIVPCEYVSISFGEELTVLRKYQDCFLMDREGNTFLHGKYDYIGEFIDGLAQVSRLTSGIKTTVTYGFINQAGHEVVPCVYEGVFPFSDGMAAVKKNDKYGFVDTEGREVIPCIYADYRGFSEGLAAVTYSVRYGVIDKEGQTVIPFEYLSIGEFSEDGFARVTKQERGTLSLYDGYIDRTGREVIPCEYDFSQENVRNGQTVVWKNGQCGVINMEGEIVIPFGMYDSIYSFGYYGDTTDETIYTVQKDNKYGTVDGAGKELAPCVYDSIISTVSDGLIVVGQNDDQFRTVSYFGYLDTKGNEVVPCVYTEASPLFFNGYAVVWRNGKLGYINRSGATVVPCMYDGFYYNSNRSRYSHFSEGVVVVCRDGGYGYVNEYGREITPFIFDEARMFSEGLAWVRVDGLWGILSLEKLKNPRMK